MDFPPTSIPTVGLLPWDCYRNTSFTALLYQRKLIIEGVHIFIVYQVSHGGVQERKVKLFCSTWMEVREMFEWRQQRSPDCDYREYSCSQLYYCTTILLYTVYCTMYNDTRYTLHYALLCQPLMSTNICHWTLPYCSHGTVHIVTEIPPYLLLYCARGS